MTSHKVDRESLRATVNPRGLPVVTRAEILTVTKVRSSIIRQLSANPIDWPFVCEWGALP